MALDQMERLALHEGLVAGLDRHTADRLMTALPDIDFDERFNRIDEQFRLVHQEFKLVHDEFKLVHGEIKFVNDQFTFVNDQFKDVHRRFEHVDHQFKQVHEHLGAFEPMIEGKVDSIVRRHFFALLGLLVAFSAATAAVVAMTFAMINAD